MCIHVLQVHACTCTRTCIERSFAGLEVCLPEQAVGWFPPSLVLAVEDSELAVKLVLLAMPDRPTLSVSSRSSLTYHIRVFFVVCTTRLSSVLVSDINILFG